MGVCNERENLKVIFNWKKERGTDLSKKPTFFYKVIQKITKVWQNVMDFYRKTREEKEVGLLANLTKL